MTERKVVENGWALVKLSALNAVYEKDGACVCKPKTKRCPCDEFMVEGVRECECYLYYMLEDVLDDKNGEFKQYGISAEETEDEIVIRFTKPK